MFGLSFFGRWKALERMAGCARDPDPEPSDPLVIDLDRQLKEMVRHGYHRSSVGPDGTRGMSKGAYRALWPRTVRIPNDCASRFTMALLVDPTIGTRGLAGFPIDVRVDPDLYRDVAPKPELGSGKRYVRFVTIGQETTTFVSPRAAETAFLPDQVGLTGWEGMHLFVQQKWLMEMRFATDRCAFPSVSISLCGSRQGTTDVPAIVRSNHGVAMLSRGLDSCENRPGGKESTRMEWTASGRREVIAID